ncbi:ABC transporter ATP-binding protein [Butyrivibrio sp. LC3010]|uniref:ABC transporter ATP-binding protein n=1 Tax=Butyrivibrio sp. LC3010 TaxID=1280680 RepID=UPI00042A8D3C|nr:ABC transporter ATP-binding protein [Butyrivibrio sp. LC3010]
MDNREDILSGLQISKKYNANTREVEALSDVSFSLKKGEILGIVGESGSGKSTLLKIISGIEKPDKGDLLYKGESYKGAGIVKTGKFLQMIFQDAYGSFDPRMTMRKSLMEISGATEKEILEITGKTGLNKELLDKKPSRLSGGQCQRMSIARALLSHADILLCDEITSALDVSTQAQVVKLLEELKKKNDLSIIFVSHDLALVSTLCDRIMVLKNGVCVEEGETSKIISNPKDAYTKLLLSSVITVN